MVLRHGTVLLFLQACASVFRWQNRCVVCLFCSCFNSPLISKHHTNAKREIKPTPYLHPRKKMGWTLVSFLPLASIVNLRLFWDFSSNNPTLFPRVLFCVLYTGAIFCPVLNLNSSARYNAPHTAQKGCEIETSATLETLEEWGVLFQGFFFIRSPPSGRGFLIKEQQS